MVQNDRLRDRLERLKRNPRASYPMSFRIPEHLVKLIYANVTKYYTVTDVVCKAIAMVYGQEQSKTKYISELARHLGDVNEISYVSRDGFPAELVTCPLVSKRSDVKLRLYTGSSNPQRLYLDAILASSKEATLTTLPDEFPWLSPRIDYLLLCSPENSAMYASHRTHQGYSSNYLEVGKLHALELREALKQVDASIEKIKN